MFPHEVRACGQFLPSRARVLLPPFSLLISHGWPLAHAKLPLLFLISSDWHHHTQAPSYLYLLLPTHILSVYTHLLTFKFLHTYFLFSCCDPSPQSLPHFFAPTFIFPPSPWPSHLSSHTIQQLPPWVLVLQRAVGQEICQGG